MKSPFGSAVLSPNLGLYFNRAGLLVPKRGLVDGINFRIKDGRLNNYNLGWTKFGTWTLDGQRVMKIFTHTDRTNGDTLFFANPTDIFKYNPAGLGSVTYMTPRYDTGTVAVAGTVVTGTGTLWLANAKANDKIMFGAAGYNGQNPSGNDSFTKVLLHFDGADASTTFVDFNAGGSAHAWTAAGNAQVDTADSVFGGASLLCDGTGDFITTPDSADFTLGASDFEITLRFKAGGGDGVIKMLAGQNDAAFTAAGTSFWISREASGTISCHVSNGVGFVQPTTVTTYTTVSNPGWHDLSFSRSGNVFTVRIDGVQQATATSAITIPNSASILAVGCAGAATANSWFGWIDEFRLSIGTPRHTSDFTPATEAFYTPWFTVLSVTLDTTINLTASAGTIAATSPYTVRKLYITGTTDQWQFATFLNDGADGKDRMFATNGVDWVQTWAFGDTQMTQQSAMAFKCRALRPYSNMMIYSNLTSPTLLPTSMINSDVGLPTHAGSLGTGLSEQFVVHDGTDGILVHGVLANSLIFYAEKHIIAAQFVGDPDVFQFRKVDREVGPIGPFAVAEFGDYHEFLGPDGGYRFDGVGANETHSHVMRSIRTETDPLRKAFTYTHFIDTEGEVIWSVPGTTDPGAGSISGQPEIGWTEHYLEDVGPTNPRPWSKRQFPFTASGYWTNNTPTLWSDMSLTWAEYATRWSDLSAVSSIQHLAGDVNGQVWVINSVQLANGVGLASYVRFPRFPTGDMHAKSRLQRVYPYITPGAGNITITVSYSNFAVGDLANSPGLVFDSSLTGDDFVSPMVKARFTSVQIGASDGIAYQVEGYNYDIAELEGGSR